MKNKLTKYSYALNINESIALDIPNYVSNAKLMDSGYTYRFAPYKRFIQEKLGGEPTWEITREFLGFRVTGTINEIKG